MKYREIAGTLAVLVFVTSVHAQQWARKMFETRSHDFGYVAGGAKAEYAFVLKNIYQADLHIASVRSSCGCATPRIEKPLLKTYEEASIVAKLNTGRLRGHQSSTITVVIDKPGYARVQLHVKAFIHGDVIIEPVSVNFGNVDQGVSTERAITVTYTRGSAWGIQEVLNDNPHLSVEFVEERRGAGRVVYKLQVRLDEHAPPGFIQDQLVLVTRDGRGRKIPVMVEGRVADILSVSPSPLYLGVVDPGGKVRKRLVVRAKKPFVIKSISTDCDCFEFEVNGDSASKSLQFVPVTFTAGNTPGAVVKPLRIETDLDQPPAEVKAYAVIRE